MGSLTLEQVRKAGQFAFRVNRSRSEAMVYRPLAGVATVIANNGLTHSPTATQMRPPQKGWHHIPGCDCPYCKEA